MLERIERTPIDLWANFFFNEKLQIRDATEVFLRLAEELAKKGSPKRRSYSERLKSRALLVSTAIDLGIDLLSLRRNGKIAIGRGLLDAWNKEYERRFGSTVGTSGRHEAIRRDIKTRLGKKGIHGLQRPPV